eukprot:365432-Chlamydomonas_euryale.AAC.5
MRRTPRTRAFVGSSVLRQDAPRCAGMTARTKRPFAECLGRSQAFTSYGYAQRIPIVATAVDCHATTIERKLQEPSIK